MKSKTSQAEKIMRIEEQTELALNEHALQSTAIRIPRVMTGETVEGWQAKGKTNRAWTILGVTFCVTRQAFLGEIENRKTPRWMITKMAANGEGRLAGEKIRERISNRKEAERQAVSLVLQAVNQ